MAWLMWLQDTSFARWVAASTSLWAYPSILTAHTVGLGVLVGGNVALDLAILGFFPGTPLAPLERLFPIMWTGFWINAVSGACLFAADAATKGTQTIFYLKLTLVALGVANMVLLRRAAFGVPAAARPGLVTSRARILARASLGIWAGAITAGRLMAYIK